MRAEKKKPTEAAFVMAFRAAQNLRQPDAARELFEHRMEVGLPPQEYAYVKVSSMFHSVVRSRGSEESSVDASTWAKVYWELHPNKGGVCPCGVTKTFERKNSLRDILCGLCIDRL